MPSPVIEPDRSIDAAVLYGVVTAFAATVGAAGLTVRVTVAVVEPSELAAITLYMTGTVDSAVGVPEMVQVVASMFSPVGSAGLAVQLVRSEERRVGKECVSTCRSRWLP